MTTTNIKTSATNVMEMVLAAKGDLAKLSDEQRADYYQAVCESVGLNPLTQPLGYILLNNKLQLYAFKGACDQLREKHGVSITRVEITREDGDQYEVMVYARNNAGREDVDLGVVSLAGLKGEALSNAKLKAITKAKRRVSLSICGLGMLDETEVDTIPGAVPIASSRTSPDPQPQTESEQSDPAQPGLKELRDSVRAAAKSAGLSPADFLAIIKSVNAAGKLPECDEAQLNEILAAIGAKGGAQ